MHVLAIDQGTTSSRAIVFNERGENLGLAQTEIRQLYPGPGWVNHDPDEIWQTVKTTAAEAIAKAGITGGEIKAVGITNQRETTLVWDRSTGKPLTPAIVWQSRQSEPWVALIRDRGMVDTYRDITGLQPDAYFSATKLAMLLDGDPELRQRAQAGEALFGTVDSWLIWKMTGGKVHATDVTNASRTMLFDIRALEWSQRLLEDLSIPREMLPAVLPSSGFFGETDSEALPFLLPISGVAGDQHAALFGQACFASGDAKCTYGTGSFMLMNSGGQPVQSQSGLLTTLAWQRDAEPVYALEGSVFITGAAVQWLRDGLGIIEASSDIEALALSVPDSDGVVFVPALVGLGAPHWDANARGLIAGITRGTTAAHIARATLEAIAMQVADVLDAMRVDSGMTPQQLRIDGGAAANDLLGQIQADLLGVTVVRPEQLETTAVGAAFLAGLAVGVWADEAAVTERWRENRRFDPAMSASERAAMLDRWHDAVERSKRWVQS
jgi:glycerol kinase